LLLLLLVFLVLLLLLLWVYYCCWQCSNFFFAFGERAIEMQSKTSRTWNEILWKFDGAFLFPCPLPGSAQGIFGTVTAFGSIAPIVIGSLASRADVGGLGPTRGHLFTPLPRNRPPRSAPLESLRSVCSIYRFRCLFNPSNSTVGLSCFCPLCEWFLKDTPCVRPSCW